MLKIKDKIKKWYDNFMLDPYFNIFMYLLCGLLYTMYIVLVIMTIKMLWKCMVII